MVPLAMLLALIAVIRPEPLPTRLVAVTVPVNGKVSCTSATVRAQGGVNCVNKIEGCGTACCWLNVFALIRTVPLPLNVGRYLHRYLM